MIVTLTGPNHYLLRRRLDELTDKFVAEHGELALQKIDAEETGAEAILEAVKSLPFLAERKMVVLKNLGANKPATEQIEQIINSAGDSTDLVLYEPAPDKRTSYFKVLKTQTKLEDYAELDTQNLAGWLVDEAKNRGGQISLADANFLVERIGTNQEQLANELAKLTTYEPKVSHQNIELLTEKTPQSRVFDLLDAAFAGHKKQALELYAEQRAQKVEPQAIMAMVAWQLQLIALAKLARKKDAGQIAREAGVSPYPVTKALRLAAKMDSLKLKELVDEAFKIDQMSKTKAIDLDEALKTYIVAL